MSNSERVPMLMIDLLKCRVLIYATPVVIYAKHRSVDGTPIPERSGTPKLDPHQSRETKVKKLLCTRIEKRKNLNAEEFNNLKEGKMLSCPQQTPSNNRNKSLELGLMRLCGMTIKFKVKPNKSSVKNLSFIFSTLLTKLCHRLVNNNKGLMKSNYACRPFTRCLSFV